MRHDMGKTITSVGQKTMDLLTSYDWPGNVRELQNVIQRAVILCEGTLVVDESWFAKRPARRGAESVTLGRLSAHEEKKLIERALAESRGRVAGPTGAAARMGIPRSTLESKIRSLRIDKHRFQSRISPRSGEPACRSFAIWRTSSRHVAHVRH